MSVASSKHSVSLNHESRGQALITADTIRNCIMEALASSSADDLLRCLAGSDWTRDYALCRVGELLQEYLRPLISAGSPLTQSYAASLHAACKACKEKDAAIAYYKQQANAPHSMVSNTSHASHKSLAKQLEDTSFVKQALEQQVVRLKEELQATADSISMLKSDRVKADIAFSELQKKVVEAQAKAAKASEDIEKADREKETTLAEVDKIERLYKNERRRAANLERELEQLQYTYGQLHKNSTAEISSLREHISLLKTDNLSLTSQIATLTSEINLKAEEERKETIKISKKLKELESQFDGLKVVNDSLEKKVEFYKEQLQKAGARQSGTHFDYAANLDHQKSINHFQEESVHESAKAMRANPFESFSSFNNRRVKELNLEVREASVDQFDNLQKFTSAKQVLSLKAENERLKIKLATLLMQIKHLKELFKGEVNTSRQELSNLRIYLFNSLEGVAQKVRLFSRRTKLLNEKDSKSRAFQKVDASPRYQNIGTQNKENRYQIYSPSNRREIPDRNPPLPTKLPREVAPRSPYFDRSAKRGVERQTTTGSFKKLHFFGKQDPEEIETRAFRLTSPLKSPVKNVSYSRWNPDDDARRNCSYEETHENWEQLGDDIIQKLQRKF